MAKKVTIQDIADALGISRNTVSKAINNADGLADATRERILQKATEMGYKQFSYVQTLARLPKPEADKKAAPPLPQGEIAMLSSSYFGISHFALLMLDRLQREFSLLGYTVNAHRISKEELRERRLPFTLRRERVAAILCIEMFDFAYGEMLCGLGIPVLMVDGPSQASGLTLPADHLLMHNTPGITRLTNLLLEKGVRRFGFVGETRHCQSFFERYMAFRGAMLLAGVPVEERHIIQEKDVPGMAQALQRLDSLPEVFLCANDFVALDLYQALQRVGKKVPEDVMVSGFDDAPESRLLTPSLTTVHIHTTIMAYTAVQLLLSRIEEPSLDFRTVYTETELILRPSTPLLLEEA